MEEVLELTKDAPTDRTLLASIELVINDESGSLSKYHPDAKDIAIEFSNIYNQIIYDAILGDSIGMLEFGIEWELESLENGSLKAKFRTYAMGVVIGLSVSAIAGITSVGFDALKDEQLPTQNITINNYHYFCEVKEVVIFTHHYTVQEGDNLFRIAKKFVDTRHNDISMVMDVIYRNNPDAFEGSKSHIKAGATLSIPSAEDIKKLYDKNK